MLKIKFISGLIIAFLLLLSCTKNNLEIHGRLVHANGKPDVGTGLNLMTDLLIKKHARNIAGGRSDSNGFFIIFARTRPNGHYYLYATGGNGSYIPLNENQPFPVNKNGITDLGEIVVSW